MILLDSSAWIEFFIEGREAHSVGMYLDNLSEVITPVIELYEVYKKIKRDRCEEEALQAVSLLNLK